MISELWALSYVCGDGVGWLDQGRRRICMHRSGGRWKVPGFYRGKWECVWACIGLSSHVWEVGIDALHKYVESTENPSCSAETSTGACSTGVLQSSSSKTWTHSNTKQLRCLFCFWEGRLLFFVRCLLNNRSSRSIRWTTEQSGPGQPMLLKQAFKSRLKWTSVLFAEML